MKIFSEKMQNSVAVVAKLLKELDINVNFQTIESDLKKHPAYPSALAIGDCLNGWKVPNQFYQLKTSSVSFKDMIFPFLAHMNEDNGKFILIKNSSESHIYYNDENGNNQKMSEIVFREKWNGVALFAEKNDSSGETNYILNKLNYIFHQLLIPFTFILLLASVYFRLKSMPLSEIFYFLVFTKILGVGVSCLLLMQTINPKNIFLKNLCNLNGNGDCNTVLKSPAANITSWLSWSEIGLYYFSGGLLTLLFFPVSLKLVALLNIVALPYIIYSITYQYRNKSWCILCCIVQFFLLSEFLLTLFFKQPLSVFSFTSTEILVFFLGYLVPVLVWSILKPLILSSHQLPHLKRQLRFLKYNGDVFKKILTQQPRYAIDEKLMPIIIGNPDANTTITLVSNPFCLPCANAHKVLEEWVSTTNTVKLKIIFSTNNQDQDEKTKIARHLMTFANQQDGKRRIEILDFWYGNNVELSQLADKFPVQYNGEVSDALEHQKNWCNMADITYTPTLLVNGYKLPGIYSLQDLKYLIN